MMLSRRKFLSLSAVAVTFPVVLRSAGAQALSSGPVRLIVGIVPAVQPISWRAYLDNAYRAAPSAIRYRQSPRRRGNTATKAAARASVDGNTLLPGRGVPCHQRDRL